MEPDRPPRFLPRGRPGLPVVAPAVAERKPSPQLAGGTVASLRQLRGCGGERSGFGGSWRGHRACLPSQGRCGRLGEPPVSCRLLFAVVPAAGAPVCVLCKCFVSVQVCSGGGGGFLHTTRVPMRFASVVGRLLAGQGPCALKAGVTDLPDSHSLAFP